ncbi:MAG: hypothetical protein OXT69_13190 [Candidatus Poribacteria bacterium]|nr:hypothetical protein [Candidatus Poribacteria bacterium]
MDRQLIVFFRAVALVLLMLTALIASQRIFLEIREAQVPASPVATNE